MGLFGKVLKSFSGPEGQMEVNINNALGKIKKSTSIKKMKSLHSKDKQFFWWFAYGIATRAGSLTRSLGSDDLDYYKTVFKVVKKALSNYGLTDSEGGSYKLEDELMNLGSQYMFGVSNYDKHQYMAAIDSVVEHMRKM